MISRPQILLVLLFAIVFGASVWAGSWYRKRVMAQAVTAQPGYCCMLSQNRCVIQKDFASCRSSGGTSFNWNQSSCEVACNPPVRRTTAPVLKAKPKTP